MPNSAVVRKAATMKPFRTPSVSKPIRKAALMIVPRAVVARRFFAPGPKRPSGASISAPASGAIGEGLSGTALGFGGATRGLAGFTDTPELSRVA